VSDQVQLEVTDGVATISLAQPETGNPMNPAMVEQFGRAVRDVRHADAGVLVIRSTGPAFSFGGDLRAFAAAPEPGDFVHDLAEDLHRLVSDLQRLDAIVVAVVRGTAAGAGLPLAAAADLVLAGSSAKFTLAYTKVGLTPDGGSSLLTASLGLHRALHLALLNPVLTAEQAQAIGLVAQVHPDDELDAAVEAVVAQLRAGSRSALVAAKRLLRDAAQPNPETLLRRESLAIRAAGDSADGREGVAAFVGKRPPAFNRS
jgi:2-(1,2-epoxy-1,2-dihydrophenyl)acetyl-CoA isomerase